MFEIKKINLSSLMSYVNSSEYDQLIHKPISPARAKSYVNNPRASGTENVLYLIYDNKEVIAYRSVLVDQIFIKNKLQKVAWFSGTWVQVNRRREGLSTMLQEEVLKDWDDQLLIANYAPNSKKLFDKTGAYQIIKTHKGIRFYRTLSLKELLTPKSNFFKRISGPLGVIDTLFNALTKIRFSTNKHFDETDYSVEKLDALEPVHLQFLENNKKNELFQRGEEEYHWINNYPWINTDDNSKEIQKNYNFSVYSDSFHSRFYCLKRNLDDKVLGLVMINVNDGRVTIPYTYLSNDHYKIVSKFILHLSNQHRVKYITCYNPKLIVTLNEKKFYFLFKKDFETSVYAHKNLTYDSQDFSKYDIQIGDGDAVFT